MQSNNVVRDAVSRVRTETEEIVRAGCARVSNQLESTAVALRECEQQFQANTKADAQEGVDAFRKQVNLLADEILGQSRQAVVSVLEDLRIAWRRPPALCSSDDIAAAALPAIGEMTLRLARFFAFTVTTCRYLRVIIAE